NTLLFCGTKPTPLATSLLALSPVMSSPLREMDPPRTFTCPKMALSRVDLPAPLGPMMPISSPCRATRLALLRMLTPGRYPAVRSLTSTTGVPVAAGVGLDCCVVGVLIRRPFGSRRPRHPLPVPARYRRQGPRQPLTAPRQRCVP